MVGDITTSYGGSRESTWPMSQRDQLLTHVVYPITDSFTGFFDYLMFKILVIAGGMSAGFALDLFSTPEDWWKGLVYLVLFDWFAGVLRAVRAGEFDVRALTRKWYVITGYFIVCGAAAILSNTFDIFYYFQFIVYASFFLKEFISILKTFKLLSTFEVMWEAVVMRRLDFDKFSEFTSEVNKRSAKRDKADAQRDMEKSHG